VLAALVAVPGKIDQQAAMAFFLIGAVHIALMLLCLKVSATMVAGWQVFGLVPSHERERPADAPRPVPVPQPAASAPRNTNVAPLASVATARRADAVPPPQVVVANDTGADSGALRDTRVVTAVSGGGQVMPLGAAPARTRGIGNRFRSTSTSAPGPSAPTPKPPPTTTPSETYQ
jgi:type IV secretion system protein VirB6